MVKHLRSISLPTFKFLDMARTCHELRIILRIESNDAARFCIEDALPWMRPISAVIILCCTWITSTSSYKLAILSASSSQVGYGICIQQGSVFSCVVIRSTLMIVI